MKPSGTAGAATLAQKIIARAAGRETVAVGEHVTCEVDLVLSHDSSGPRRYAQRLEALGVPVWDPDKVVLVTDHFVPATDARSANVLAMTRRWAKDNGVNNFYDMQGICHVVLPEKGHLRPGMLAVGGDSHSPTGGAYGAFMVGIGATDMTGVLATGRIWLRVPRTIRVEWTGALGPAMSAKDMILHLCAKLGMGNDYRVIEFAGETVTGLPMSERMVLTNMSAELGAKTGIIAADATTLADIRARGGDVADAVIDQYRSDDNAEFEAEHRFDAADLPPQVAAPHSPDNTRPVDEHLGVAVDQAYIGACTGAKHTDLQMAAAVLKGRKVRSGTRLMIAPASLEATRLAAADGTLEILTEAGAILLPTGCGACAGMGAGALAAGETCISSTSRNFRGRMGDPGSSVYLASPFTVAAAAVAGEIVDPREFVA
ncbi:MAG: aconitase/3-isopropylmalate dehydratase large subunit family protein [Pseudomonadota bacterium]